MFRSPWVWVLVGAVVAVVVGSLRWTLEDFLLDQFGSLMDRLSRRDSNSDDAEPTPG